MSKNFEDAVINDTYDLCWHILQMPFVTGNSITYTKYSYISEAQNIKSNIVMLKR